MRMDALICGRENDLVSFLYGELNEVEVIAFERHRQQCAACNTELAAFGPVRESVVAWRNESLGRIGLPSQPGDSSPTAAARARPSAVAALREFFNLSPLWMKGAVAFAAVLFCVFAGLALAHLRDKAPSVVVVTPIANPISSQEFNAQVDKRVQEELNQIKKSSEQLVSSPVASKDSAQKNPGKRIPSSTEVALKRRPLSKTEREQLAADLRLVTANDSDLDLLDDRINQ